MSAATYRGWDLWVEGRRIGAHIINKWPENAIKVVTRDQLPADQWVHVAVAYDGSSKAAGVQVYVNGKSQPTNVHGRFADRDDSQQRAVQDRPAEHDVAAVGRDDSRRARLRAPACRRRDRVAGQAVAVGRSSPRRRRSAARPISIRLYDWWLASLDDEYQIAGEAARSARSRAEPTSRPAARSGYVMQEKPEAPIAFVLNRGEYDQRKDQVAPGTPAMLPPFPADLPRNRLGLRQVAAAARASAHGARHGQSLLERSVRHRPREDGRRLRRLRRVAVASGAARLAGRRVPRIGLGREEAVQADGHVGHVSPKRGRHEGEAGEGSARIGCSRAARGSAWMPRWFATTRWRRAACCRRRSAARA